MSTSQAAADFVCPGCGIHLPLKHPEGREHVEVWICNNCGARVQGIFNSQCRETVRSNVVRSVDRKTASH